MAAGVRGKSLWWVHAAVYVLVALLLLVWALPINWDTPTNLEYQEGWGSLALVVGAVSLVFGSGESILWTRGLRVGALTACLLGAAFAFAGMGFYLDGPMANGDEVWTSGREQVAISQLLWGGYWVAQTLVVAAWLLLLGRGAGWVGHLEP